LCNANYRVDTGRIDIMSRCASCGRPIDASRPNRGGCTSCTWRAAVQASQAAPDSAAPSAATEPDRTDEPTPLGESIEDLMAQLRAYAAVVGEDLGKREPRVAHALSRGNSRPYRAELNRIASRFVAQLENTWAA
jgi:hypothetical protein